MEAEFIINRNANEVYVRVLMPATVGETVGLLFHASERAFNQL